MTKKIASFAPLDGNVLRMILETDYQLSDIEVIDVHKLPEEEIIRQVTDAVVLLGDWSFSTPITRRIILAAKKAKLIQQPTVGYDTVDCATCNEVGLRVANTSGASDISVAEFTVMLALCLAKNIININHLTHSGRWLSNLDLLSFNAYELFEKDFGIIGMGRIGKLVAKRLQGFGVRLLYHDIRRLSLKEEEEYSAFYLDLDELLRKSDVVSIHLPLTDKTNYLIGDRELSLMKKSSFLINVSRGSIVNEKALANVLEKDMIAGAAIDVFKKEPYSSDNPLLNNRKVILTPHAAGTTKESLPRYLEIALSNVARILRGEEPINIVNL